MSTNEVINMKNNRTFLKTVLLLTPLLLTSCDLLNSLTPTNNSRRRSSNADVSQKADGNTRHTHQWSPYETTKEATCTEDGEEERYCTVCDEVQTRVIKASHKWGEWTVIFSSTCVEQGMEERICSVCHDFQQRSLPLQAHDWVEAEMISEPTCESSGSMRYVCSFCQQEKEESVPALGHIFEVDENGEEIVNWMSVPTCTEGGEGYKRCARCEYEEYIYMDALGHDIRPVDDGTEPEEGMAKVRLYECTRCGVASFGFKANEVTEASKDHLVFEQNGDEVGARFWGRPIGNAMDLDETGSASSSSHEAVFDPTVQGDFFEYRFVLTTEQAAALQNCYCYCDAKPAAYLGGQDFWACDPTAEEWTQGFYIEDNPNTPDIDEFGMPIQDYRYILYVDGEPVQFDPNMKVPVSGRAGSEPRQEYIMPYLFNLHEGENSISLRMAGGYRSMFYNFIFRPADFY